MAAKDIIELLRGGDRRSIGRSDQVARIVASRPRLFAKLIAALWSDDLLVRMRAADAAEKVTRTSPQLLGPYKKHLLGLMKEASEQELRWHLAAMIPRLLLTPQERNEAAATLFRYLDDRSSIVKTSALQGLADLTGQSARMRPALIEILRQAARSGTPAMRARSRKLLLQFDRE